MRARSQMWAEEDVEVEEFQRPTVLPVPPCGLCSEGGSAIGGGAGPVLGVVREVRGAGSTAALAGIAASSSASSGDERELAASETATAKKGKGRGRRGGEGGRERERWRHGARSAKEGRLQLFDN